MKLKQNKFFILVMTLMLAATAFFTVPVKTSAEVGPNVQLISAKTISKNGHLFTVGYVKTALTGSAGLVTIHYQIGIGAWQDTNANYISMKENSYNLWYFQIDGGIDQKITYQNYSVDFRFDIKFSVDGQDYWDNNNSNDYRISAGYTPNYSNAVLGSANLAFDGASSYIGAQGAKYFTGNLHLKNLAYAKTVKVIYSYDNWVTTQTTYANYNHTEVNGFEDWYFLQQLPQNTTQIKFSISYTVNGATYLDNNFGNNYTLNVPGSLQ